MANFELQRGTAPLLISLPHDGSFIPEDIAARMHPAAQRSPDTDWHVHRLYAPLAQALGASMLWPSASRYVIDLNRPADGQALYPGRRETGLVSTIGFDGAPLYRDGMEPDAAETGLRVARWWQPYHAALAAELDALRARHGRVLLWEGHSIRSRVPMLFDGVLPDLNLGTAGGASCVAPRRDALARAVQAQTRYSHVLDGRFKGGYITRHYGRPADGIDAVQLELAQATYMDEDSLDFDERRAAALRETIGTLIQACLAASPRAG